MKKREIIIVVAAVVIVIYGLLDFFVFSTEGKSRGEQMNADHMDRLTAFTESAVADLSAVTVQKEFLDMRYLISKAESEWLHDPFIVYGTGHVDDIMITEDILITEDIPEISYTGFIQAGKQILAILNGMEYMIGEKLVDIGYTVSSITPSSVVLLTDFNNELILQLEEN